MIKVISDFRKLYMHISKGNLTVAQRQLFLKRLKSLFEEIEEGGFLPLMMDEMNDLLTKTQKLQYSLVANKVQLTDTLYYTYVDEEHLFFIDTVALNKYGNYGCVTSVNLKKMDVNVVDGYIVVSDSSNRAVVWSRGMEHFDFSTINSRYVSSSYASKGGTLDVVHSCMENVKRYLSVSRSYSGIRINHRLHYFIAGMTIGYISMLAVGSSSYFVINHIDSDHLNNHESNLELVTQFENVVAYMNYMNFCVDSVREIELSSCAV